MDLQSNQDGDAANAFLERFEQWKLECQQEYLSYIKLIFDNQEAKRIFLNLGSYVCSYEKEVRGENDGDNGWKNVSENILISKPINEISENETTIGRFSGKRFVSVGKMGLYHLLREEEQKQLEKILDSNNTLKNSSPEYKKKLIYSCGMFALKAISEQEAMEDIVKIFLCGINWPFDGEIRIDENTRSMQLSFDDIDVTDILDQNIDDLWQRSGIEDYVDNEKYDWILKDMLTCPDFVKLISSFNIGADNDIYRELKRSFWNMEDPYVSELSQEELNLLKAFRELKYMSYGNIKQSIEESGLSESNAKKLYKMMACADPVFHIFEDIKIIMGMYANGVLSFKEVTQILKLKHNEKAYCLNSGYDNSLRKMCVFAVIFDRYLNHDYDAYLENYVENQSKHNSYKTLQDAVLDLIDCIATENKISAKQVNDSKEMIKSACNINIFGVIIQFIKNLFLREENRAVMRNYKNIKLDRLASNIMKILPEILTTICRDDTIVADDEDGKNEVKDIQVVKIVSLGENNIVPKQSSGVEANNINENKESLSEPE